MKPEPLPETPEFHDPVWGLLARGTQPRVPNDFVAQVMAEARLTPQETAAPSVTNIVVLPTARRTARIWGSLAAAAAVAFGLYLHFQNKPDSTISAQEQLVVFMPQTVVGSEEGSLEQELTAVQDMHALIAVEDPTQLNDAQLFALLN
jgi:hypothetical protein